MFKKLFLPVGILIAVLWALYLPAGGLFCKKYITTHAMIVVIFLISGMQIKLDELKFDRSFLLGLPVGAVFTLILLPFAGWAVLRMMPWDPTLLAGLLVILAAPPTLSSGIVMTQQAQGNMMLAIAITILFNLAAIITLPLVLGFLLGQTESDNVDTIKMFKQLILTVMLPLSAGYIIKKSILRSWYNKLLDYIPLTATIMLSLVFFADARDHIFQINVPTVILILGISLVLHLLSMAVPYWIGQALKMSIGDCKAMIFCGASKSATVALAMIAIAELQQSAAVVSCLLFYALQLFLDSALASHAGKYAGKAPADPVI